MDNWIFYFDVFLPAHLVRNQAKVQIVNRLPFINVRIFRFLLHSPSSGVLITIWAAYLNARTAASAWSTRRIVPPAKRVVCGSAWWWACLSPAHVTAGAPIGSRYIVCCKSSLTRRKTVWSRTRSPRTRRLLALWTLRITTTIITTPKT